MRQKRGKGALYLIKYTIPLIPPSNNEYIGRTNYREYQKAKKEWCGYVNMFCNPKPSKPLNEVIVKITYYFATKIRRDPDNYSGKMLLDGLVKNGILHDDSFDCIDLVLNGSYDKNNPRTEIEFL